MWHEFWANTVILTEFRLEIHYGPLLYALNCTRLRRMVPFRNSSSAQNIESLQYQAGKIILKTKMSFPKSALLSEFGWEPINQFLDQQRVNYFARFDELPPHRLCKIVFMELKNSECVEWKYVNHMKNIFQSIGLDHYYYGIFNTNILNHFFR